MTIDRAMVFAAGLGTRMRPITDTLPKPLVKVAGRTMLDHMLDRLAQAKVREAIVNVHYRADAIEAALKGRTQPNIVISDEREKLLDQAGGIKKVLPKFAGQPFFICNTDAVWIEGPLDQMAQLQRVWDPARMDVLLMVAATTGSVGVDWPGDFFMDPDGRLSRRGERLTAPFVYAGVGVLKPQLFEQAEGDVIRLAPYFFAAAEQGRLFGMRLNGLWLHVGTPQALVEAEAAYARSAV